MITNTFTTPTPDQVDAAIRAAHKARAAYLREMFQGAAQWLAHPHFGQRTA